MGLGLALASPTATGTPARLWERRAGPRRPAAAVGGLGCSQEGFWGAAAQQGPGAFPSVPLPAAPAGLGAKGAAPGLPSLQQEGIASHARPLLFARAQLHLGVSSGLSQFSGQPHGGRGCHFRARAARWHRRVAAQGGRSDPSQLRVPRPVENKQKPHNQPPKTPELDGSMNLSLQNPITQEIMTGIT